MSTSEPERPHGSGAHRQQKPMQQHLGHEKGGKASDCLAPNGMPQHWDARLGTDFGPGAFSRHAAPLGDPRMSQLSNTLHQAMIVRQL